MIFYDAVLLLLKFHIQIRISFILNKFQCLTIFLEQICLCSQNQSTKFDLFIVQNEKDTNIDCFAIVYRKIQFFFCYKIHQLFAYFQSTKGFMKHNLILFFEFMIFKFVLQYFNQAYIALKIYDLSVTCIFNMFINFCTLYT